MIQLLCHLLRILYKANSDFLLPDLRREATAWFCLWDLSDIA